MANHYIQRYDLSKYTLKSFDGVDEICADTNNSDALTYNANGTQKVISVLTGSAPVDVTASTLTLAPATHAGKIVTLDLAAGIAVTLPAATGSGNRYELFVRTTFTGAASVAVANASDYMIGVAQMGIDGGTAVPHQYPTANTGTVSTESDTISLFGTANSQGGIKGARVSLIDIAANIWSVLYVSDAGGTEATPFSAAV